MPLLLKAAVESTVEERPFKGRVRSFIVPCGFSPLWGGLSLLSFAGGEKSYFAPNDATKQGREPCRGAAQRSASSRFSSRTFPGESLLLVQPSKLCRCPEVARMCTYSGRAALQGRVQRGIGFVGFSPCKFGRW